MDLAGETRSRAAGALGAGASAGAHAAAGLGRRGAGAPGPAAGPRVGEVAPPGPGTARRGHSGLDVRSGESVGKTYLFDLFVCCHVSAGLPGA